MRLSKYRPSRETSLELSTTSMIDVVFLLLIFFLVTTTFLTPERQIKPDIRVQENKSSSITDDIDPAFVDIIRQNRIAVYRVGTTITTDLDMIERVLQQYPDKTKGAFVRMSDTVPFGMAAAAINRCKRSGFTRVSIIPLQ